MVLNMGSYEEHVGREEGSVVLLDPVVLELNRLQNLVAEKNRELGAAHSEIKALKATEAKKDKALEELKSEVDKLDDKLRATENLLEHKNLEIKRLTTEKKDAVAAQYAAEATLRRVYANQKDDDSLTLASVVAPLEAKIKMYKNEVLLLQEDKKALERLTKSKEAALLEAEKILRSALERALIVEEVQNHNFELKRQIEICQEENRILEKTNRQKVIEVERLGQTIKDLEEAILAGGATANMVRDYKRQIEELHEEKRTLERELARAKVSAHRVATVVANEWKDESDRVMPVKQWLEERKLLQAFKSYNFDALMGMKRKMTWKSMIVSSCYKAESDDGDRHRVSKKGLSQRLSLSDASNPSSPLSIDDLSNSLVGPKLHVFSFAQLRTITHNFASSNLLGEGGFGPVYKGFVDDKIKPGLEAQPVAVKLLDLHGSQGHKEWLAEIIILGQMRHQNLVKLIGYCWEEDYRLLVYEYMARRSLENQLFRKYSAALPWSTRMKIALEAAKGLQFLHEADPPVIFRDFKTSNILLDSDYTTKLSDLGLAKDGVDCKDQPDMTCIMGTRGYAAPEYVKSGESIELGSIQSIKNHGSLQQDNIDQ